MLRFLGTKIGISLVLAIILIAGATYLKIRNPQATSSLQNEVGLIAKESVKEAIEKGEIETPWEDILTSLGSTTKSENATVPDPGKTTTQQKPLTATDRFARVFLTKYVNLRESGAPIDENTATDLINQLLTEDYGSAAEERTYTEDDLTILDSNSPQTLKTYANSVGLTLQSPLAKGYEHELTVISRITDTENTADLAKLDLNIARYKEIRDGLLDTAVPSALKKSHLALINAINDLYEGVEGMKLIEEDPVGATKMISRYQEGLNSLELPLEQIKAYLIRQSVTFSSRDSGYLLIK